MLIQAVKFIEDSNPFFNLFKDIFRALRALYPLPPFFDLFRLGKGAKIWPHRVGAPRRIICSPRAKHRIAPIIFLMYVYICGIED